MGRLTAAERAELRVRSAEARVAARAATERYAALLVESQRRIVQSKEALQQVDDARREVQGTVCRYAVLLKSLETSPERTLVLVKSLVDESTPRSLGSGDVMSAVVSWCIEAYYSVPPAA